MRSRLPQYAAVALLGFLITLAVKTASPGPRLAHRARLIDLIAEEDAAERARRAQLDDLQAQLDRLQRGLSSGGSALAAVRRQIESLGFPAGTEAVTGPGVAVEMRDSTLRRSPTGDPNDLVIHEQDIQAVVNAVWSGGAEAVSINGERITSDSAVRCVGNTLLLHGAVYAPPYRIAAIGRQSHLVAALRADPLVRRFRVYVEDFKLGFDVSPRARIDVPAFGGVFARAYARAA
jgi:uncharacterized protein YlxW (UPF0749 family)